MLTVNQIYKDLISLIELALQSQGLNWQVIQTYQQSMGNIKPPFVMLHRLTTSNYGFQYGKDKDILNVPTHTENQVEIQTYQIEANYRRTTLLNIVFRIGLPAGCLVFSRCKYHYFDLFAILSFSISSFFFKNSV